MKIRITMILLALTVSISLSACNQSKDQTAEKDTDQTSQISVTQSSSDITNQTSEPQNTSSEPQATSSKETTSEITSTTTDSKPEIKTDTTTSKATTSKPSTTSKPPNNTSQKPQQNTPSQNQQTTSNPPAVTPSEPPKQTETSKTPDNPKPTYTESDYAKIISTIEDYALSKGFVKDSSLYFGQKGVGYYGRPNLTRDGYDGVIRTLKSNCNDIDTNYGKCNFNVVQREYQGNMEFIVLYR